jgi:2-succinyl-5-enolpyruvyl-6-hydroxy-3-cyclohexene-1-carboxylate synthase
MNVRWSQDILEQLFREGVREFVCCAGARNSPLVMALASTKGIKTYSFFEERSAAFFAMGAALRSQRPVAILTTSGTAAAELLPAVVEAFHTGIPLICVTADRPRRLRGTGAPQAIDQTGLFARFVGVELDLEGGEMPTMSGWNRRSPVHLNVCFDEPLIDMPPADVTLDDHLAPKDPPFAGRSAFDVSAGLDWAVVRLTKFLRGEGPMIVLVGTLESEAEREATVAFLAKLRAPVYVEATSGLRGRVELDEISLRSGERILSWALREDLMARVLRIGGVPTARVWRDLDESDSTIEVMSVCALPFAGLSRGEMLCTELAPLFEAMSVENDMSAQAATSAFELIEKDRMANVEIHRLFVMEPKAEPSLFHHLSRRIPENALVYLGNSLPIREWDLAASYDYTHKASANRGVNGIDGQVSTFLGMAVEAKENWAIIGDLTALYDLVGPWAAAARPEIQFRLVVVNNGGGKIFSRIFKEPLFENRHKLNFKPWAEMWGLGYRKWSEIPEEYEAAASELIEIVPDADATHRFWQRYEQLWV